MDKEEIRDLLGNTMFARAQRCQSHVVSMDCETNGKGVRHLTALVDGTELYETQVWLRANGT